MKIKFEEANNNIKEYIRNKKVLSKEIEKVKVKYNKLHNTFLPIRKPNLSVASTTMKDNNNTINVIMENLNNYLSRMGIDK